ncbi:MAG: prepilin-type N-terminal cleavage/methylation domain-containing protein [Neisseria sp.]|uniref:type IV pilin protein n=1 Tax=Neisseria sp. TaxID=192066 RepID=UPI0026DABF84|nr:prepilin-type N-terminal cleavage/methylation domain-containing protein [Neisseria sp.]MDO4640200.1 prepilin-type N-terminal cleavage/methylation domain-containing protein [Neisseria sp.]
MKTKSRGFTLIEVLIAVAILGILVTIALPSYTRYVERGNVTNAKAALIQIQHYVKQQTITQPTLSKDSTKIAEWVTTAQKSVDKTVSDKYDISYDNVNNYIIAVPKATTGYTFAARVDNYANAVFCKNAEAAKSKDGNCKPNLSDL